MGPTWIPHESQMGFANGIGMDPIWVFDMGPIWVPHGSQIGFANGIGNNWNGIAFTGIGKT